MQYKFLSTRSVTSGTGYAQYRTGSEPIVRVVFAHLCAVVLRASRFEGSRSFVNGGPPKELDSWLRIPGR